MLSIKLNMIHLQYERVKLIVTNNQTTTVKYYINQLKEATYSLRDDCWYYKSHHTSQEYEKQQPIDRPYNVLYNKEKH